MVLDSKNTDLENMQLSDIYKAIRRFLFFCKNSKINSDYEYLYDDCVILLDKIEKYKDNKNERQK